MRTTLSSEILLWIKLTLYIANSLQNLDTHEEILNSFIKPTQTVLHSQIKSVLTNSFSGFIIAFVIIIIYICIEFSHFSFNIFEFIFLVSLRLLILS